MSLAKLKIIKQNPRYNSPLAFIMSGKEVKVLIDAINEVQYSALLEPMQKRSVYNSTLAMPLSGYDVKDIVDSIACPPDLLRIIKNQLRYNTKYEYILTGKHVKIIVDALQDTSCIIVGPPPGDALILVFTDVNSTGLPSVNDPEVLADWNTQLSSDFTDVYVDTGTNTVYLYGGTTADFGTAFDGAGLVEILAIEDEIGVVTAVLDMAFQLNTFLVSIILPACLTLGQYAFEACTSLQAAEFPALTSMQTGSLSTCSSLQRFEFPLCTSVGDVAFSNCTAAILFDLRSCTTWGSVPASDDGVFAGILGNTITLTIPAAFALEPEVVQLETDNTVTTILV